MTQAEDNSSPPEPSRSSDSVPDSNAPLASAETSSAAFQAGHQPAPGLTPSAAAVPEDLRVPWDWIDLVIFALLAVGGTFLVSVALLGVFSFFGVGPRQLRASATAKSYFAILNQILLSFALLGYLAIQTKLRADASFWRTIGWRPLVTKHIPKTVAYLLLIGGGFLLSLCVELASSLSKPRENCRSKCFFRTAAALSFSC